MSRQFKGNRITMLEQIGAEAKYQRKRMIFERTVANNLYSIGI
jgi:hypothetical protein